MINKHDELIAVIVIFKGQCALTELAFDVKGKRTMYGAGNEDFFEITSRDSGAHARTGRLTTAHGVVRTPAFMPVGTRAAIRAVRPDEVAALGYEMILSNAYHLMLRPGIEVVENAGGIHAFMGWKGSILTDSGGYQIFSLSKDVEVERAGVRFRSTLDGSTFFLTPELSVEHQFRIGSDIAMVLDECLPYPSEREEVIRSVELTRQWAEKALETHKRIVGRGHDTPNAKLISGEGNDSNWDFNSGEANSGSKIPGRRDSLKTRQLLFGIVQGGIYPDLRIRSARYTVACDFDGYGIGGLSVGEPRELTMEILQTVVCELPDERPRYLMGVGDPLGMAEAVACGVDLFDSALPTRIARNGAALIGGRRVNMRNARYKEDKSPLSETCACYACRNFSRSYIRHLVLAKEILGLHLLTVHNLHEISSLFKRMRESIERSAYMSFLEEMRDDEVML